MKSNFCDSFYAIFKRYLDIKMSFRLKNAGNGETLWKGRQKVTKTSIHVHLNHDDK